MVAAAEAQPSCLSARGVVTSLELKVRILASDSVGVRSMATVVCAGGIKIFVDPGVSYAPRRYGLPPHELELKRVEEVKERIVSELADSDVVIITHYHYDHYLYRPEDVENYRGKWLIVKDPTNNINVSQRIRAHRLFKLNRVNELASRVDVLDSREYKINDGVIVRGSKPVPHGADTRLGYVIMVLIECCGIKFAHASDVQGPMSEEALDILVKWRPDVLFISGPPTYFEGYKVDRSLVRKGLENLKVLARKLSDSTIIIADHHFARDLNYPELLSLVRRESGGIVISAAEFMGVKYEPLEAMRKDLWRMKSGEETSDSNRAGRRNSLKMDPS